MIELTPRQEYNHYIEDKCFICEKPFYKDDDNDDDNKYKKKSMMN